MAHHEGRLQAAGLNAQAAHVRVRRKAEALLEEMEEITSPHNLPRVTDLDDDDSMVIAVERVISTGKRNGTHG